MGVGVVYVWCVWLVTLAQTLVTLAQTHVILAQALVILALP